MRLTDYVAMARAHWLALASFVAVGALAAGLLALLATPTYDAKAELVVVTDSGGTAAELAQAATYSQRQVRTFSAIASRPLVLEPALDDLDVDWTPGELSRHVTVASLLNTDVIAISANAESPQLAADIANAVATHLSEAVESLVPSLPSGKKSVTLDPIRVATPPANPSSPNTPLWLVLGIIAGFVIGACFVALREALDTKVRTADDASLRSRAPLLGTVVHDRRNSSPVATAGGSAIRAEAYRHLRTSLSFIAAAGDGRKTFAVTSSIPGEGKTTTALNLAVSVAAAGQKVCLVDADLRRPTLAKAAGLEGSAGLSTVLAGRVDVLDVLQPHGGDNLHVLTSGEIPPNPSELLSSPRMATLLADLAARFDVVILDCPPLLPVTDAAIIGHACDGVLLVVGLGIVRKTELARALSTLEIATIPLLGVVANYERPSDRAHYGYSYGAHPAPQKAAPEAVDPLGHWEPTLASAGSHVSRHGPGARAGREPEDVPQPAPAPEVDRLAAADGDARPARDTGAEGTVQDTLPTFDERDLSDLEPDGDSPGEAHEEKLVPAWPRKR